MSAPSDSPPASTSYGATSSWRLRALLFSVAAAATIYLGFSIWSGWDDVQHAFLQIGLFGTLIALSLSLINYGLRFVRWQLYLRRLGHAVPHRPSLRIYLSGFALTTTPGKAGEMLRGVLLERRGVPISRTFAAFISERLSDLLAILFFTLLGITQVAHSRPLIIAGFLLFAAALLTISSTPIQAWLRARIEHRDGRLFTLIGHLLDTLHSARQCHRPSILALSTLISIIAWGAEAYALFLTISWLGVDISLTTATFIYAISMLAGALSFLPGGLGSAEAVMASLLVASGMPLPTAIATTVFIRLATLWFAVAIGLITLLQSRHSEEL